MEKIKVKEFFKSITYISDDASYRNNSLSNHSQFPVFSTHELETEPLKWLKYILLGRLELRNISDLSSEIIRFPIDCIPKVQQYCIRRLENANTKGKNILLVIKLVPLDLAGHLPNTRITSPEDIENAFKMIEKSHKPSHKEIWVCESLTEMGKLNFGGRYILPSSKSLSSILEVVWYASPRLLEEINFELFPYPYLRARAEYGTRMYKIEELRIPKEIATLQITTQSQLLQEFKWLLSKIYSYREKISDLEAILNAAGARELSLEFKSDDGHFRFIDWDTEVETGGWKI
jgi:hypothetical protein